MVGKLKLLYGRPKTRAGVIIALKLFFFCRIFSKLQYAGIFNGPKKIPQGTFIGIYAGELLTDKVAHARGL